MTLLDKFKKGIGVESDVEPLTQEPAKPQRKRVSSKRPKKLEIKTEQVRKTSETTEEKIPEALEKENKENWPEKEGQLAVDVYETPDNFLVVAAIAGVLPENLEILAEKDMLIIKGNRQNPENPSEKKNYFYQECYWGPFSRKIILPENVDSSKITAEMDKGILIIKLPKIQKEEKIDIKVK